MVINKRWVGQQIHVRLLKIMAWGSYGLVDGFRPLHEAGGWSFGCIQKWDMVHDLSRSDDMAGGCYQGAGTMFRWAEAGLPGSHLLCLGHDVAGGSSRGGCKWSWSGWLSLCLGGSPVASIPCIWLMTWREDVLEPAGDSVQMGGVGIGFGGSPGCAISRVWMTTWRGDVIE